MQTHCGEIQCCHFDHVLCHETLHWPRWHWNCCCCGRRRCWVLLYQHWWVGLQLDRHCLADYLHPSAQHCLVGCQCRSLHPSAQHCLVGCQCRSLHSSAQHCLVGCRRCCSRYLSFDDAAFYSCFRHWHRCHHRRRCCVSSLCYHCGCVHVICRCLVGCCCLRRR